MGTKTRISWTDHTFNGWTGCTEVSPGCDNCYARKLVRRFGYGWGAGAPRQKFKNTWSWARVWNKQAEVQGKPHLVFAMSLADWADSEAPEEWREEMWQLIRDTPYLYWQLLTKRHLSHSLFPNDWWSRPNGYPNVWLGVSVEGNGQLYRLENLLEIPARVHFVSYEPALEYVDFGPYWHIDRDWTVNKALDWLVIGGESHQESRARPFDPEWARQNILKSRGDGKVFVKQLGSNCGLNLSESHGADPKEWPEDLRVQEFPL